MTDLWLNEGHFTNILLISDRYVDIHRATICCSANTEFCNHAKWDIKYLIVANRTAAICGTRNIASSLCACSNTVAAPTTAQRSACKACTLLQALPTLSQCKGYAHAVDIRSPAYRGDPTASSTHIYCQKIHEVVWIQYRCYLLGLHLWLHWITMS